ncbi:MAG: segregation and condensation protein A [Blastomonas sp.]
MRCWHWCDAGVSAQDTTIAPPDGDYFFFSEPVPAATVAAEALLIDVDGWEGPLDLLLDLARRQKVDLRQISILDLTNQYLGFIESATSLKLELAADYLVMAAWLAYLKSALLLPGDPEVEPSPEELALRLQLRLQRLAAMREAAARLLGRDRLGRDVFAHGQGEGLRLLTRTRHECSLFDLLTAYGRVKQRSEPVVHMVKSRRVMTLEDALARLSLMLGTAIEWTDLRAFLPVGAPADLTRSATASTFLALLELARQGRVELAQEEAFAPLRARRTP